MPNTSLPEKVLYRGRQVRVVGDEYSVGPLFYKFSPDTNCGIKVRTDPDYVPNPMCVKRGINNHKLRRERLKEKNKKIVKPAPKLRICRNKQLEVILEKEVAQIQEEARNDWSQKVAEQRRYDKYRHVCRLPRSEAGDVSRI